MTSKRLSDDDIRLLIQSNEQSQRLAEHYWLAYFWKWLRFGPTFSAPEAVQELIVPTEYGRDLVRKCSEVTGVLIPDVTLALYGRFFWHDVLIDYAQSDEEGVIRLLNDELLGDRVRIPFVFGRDLHDRLHDRPSLGEHDTVPHADVWDLLADTPIGVFQHGTFICGPFGIIRSDEHRWIPLRSSVRSYFRRGTKVLSKVMSFEPADIDVVKAYAWLEHQLSTTHGPHSNWGKALAWHGSIQVEDEREDYSDIPLIIADCFIRNERTMLFESVLKTNARKTVREVLKQVPSVKGLATLPPNELATLLDEYQQLQVLLTVPNSTLIIACDNLIQDHKINVPESELRVSRSRGPCMGICFPTEVSSLGLRAAHPQPFAALCLAITRAYEETDTTNELHWRLGSDPTRGLQVSVTEFVRREGPADAVETLILSSHSVTTVICGELGLDLAEALPRTAKTVPRILWKFGFEIPRHDELLKKLNLRITKFEDIISQVDLDTGEAARERIRSEGVNLFVSVEAFLDRVIAYNTWLLASDHWGDTRFEYHLSSARCQVSNVLGETIDTPDGSVTWKTNGENALGTQLAYLNAFQQWLDTLEGDGGIERVDTSANVMRDSFQRPFPFRHTQLWADADPVEMQRYRKVIADTAKLILQADVAGVRNGLDHHRDPARFPTSEQLLLCVTRLKMGVRAAEQNRVYPVTFWLESIVEKSFGAKEYVFASSRGEKFSIYRPATVSSLPGIPRTRPVIFAPVNFLGTADSVLLFKVWGESEYSQYWSGFPRIMKVLPVKTKDELTTNDGGRDEDEYSDETSQDVVADSQSTGSVALEATD